MAKKRRIISQKFYNRRTLHKEREYGFYWYSGLWHLVRPLLVFTISLIIVSGVMLSGWNMIYESILMPMDPDDDTLVTFRIKSGQSVSSISNSLVDQNLLRSKTVFKMLVMFQGVTSKIQYGDYLLSPNMTAGEIINVLSSGSAVTERTITIIPGWTIDDIADYFLRIGAIEDKTAFLELCNDVNAFKSASHQLTQAADGGRLSERKYALEGYLAPDTYRVFLTATPEELIKTLLAQTEIVLDGLYDASLDVDPAVEEGEEAVFRTNLTQDEIIILASMIEKEAAQKDDFSKVSAVFYNRLQQGMRLESDPTAKYTQGLTNMVLTSDQLDDDSPYNTYVISGLPAGPICNPSEAALTAALHPNQDYLDEGYLFFCSKDPNSGELYFSKTLEEHQAAVAEYRPLWIAFDEEQARKAAEEAQATATPDPSASVDPNASPDATATPKP